MRGAGGELHPTRARDYRVQVPRRWGFQTVFGRRTTVPNNSEADIWTGAAMIRPLVLTGTKTMSIVSSSASDAFGVSGAQVAGVTFIDGNGDWRISDLVPLAGLAKSTITYHEDSPLVTSGDGYTIPDGDSVPAPIFRIQDVILPVALGATENNPYASNIGEITVVDAANKVFEHIPIKAGRSYSAAFHCPRGYLGRLTFAPVGSANGAGEFFLRSNFGVGTAFQMLPLTTVNNTSALFTNDAATTPITPRSDLQVAVVVGSNNISVNATMEIRLEPLT